MFVVVVVVVIVVVDHCCTLVMAMLIVLITNLRNTPVYCCRFFVVIRVWVWGSVDVGVMGWNHYLGRRPSRHRRLEREHESQTD